jgi:serine/threonine protein kinase
MDRATLGNFALIEKIGEGGMGSVYKARDRRLERLVAIKLLPEGALTNPERRARFVQEAKAASALNHPNIITIHDIAEQEGQTFIVMELVEGKSLHELISRKGMRLNEALRVAAQVADALTAAHAVGIVHRDLKPANIMVDVHGRAKVLDFGLAKLSTPAASVAAAEDEETRTLTRDQLLTEDGVILGSVPYMSPEQAEGKPVDARSDIFSFGALLYEMITGQRAFASASRISTLAAIVEKDPRPPSEIRSTTPPEVERLILRCLRKDVTRRSQNMAGVKLALEELRDESASGSLARPRVADSPRARAWRWLYPGLAMAVLIAVATFDWTYLNRGAKSQGPDLIRVSPDDGYSYSWPAISPDGRFVTYVSDRVGQRELFLQQVGEGDPLQLTHPPDPVSFPSFFPDGKRIAYVTASADGRTGTINVISTLGGEPQVLIKGPEMNNWSSMVSPDGRLIAYFEEGPVMRLMIMSSTGGQPRELSKWAKAPSAGHSSMATWTTDSRYLLNLITKPSKAGASDWDWFAVPVDGGDLMATGVGEKCRAAGLGWAIPLVVVGDRVIFGAGERMNAWEIRLSPGTWRVSGFPRQLTFGTQSEQPTTISAAGSMALQVDAPHNDLYLIPLSPVTGQPSGVARRLTQDGRTKRLRSVVGGEARSAYFSVLRNDPAYEGWDYYALDLERGKQVPLTTPEFNPLSLAISPDERLLAYAMETESYSISVGDTGGGSKETRVVCTACGRPRFSPDGRFLFYRAGPPSRRTLSGS